MPIYHFNLADHRRDDDPTGTELRDPRQARIEAIRFTGAYLADHPELIEDGQSFEVRVTDHQGIPVVTVAVELHE